MAEEKDFLFGGGADDPKTEKKPPPKKPKSDHVAVGFDLLSDEDKEEIRKQAEALVAEDFKKEARKKLLDLAVQEERQRYAPEEEIVSIQIDLPGHSNQIRINNRIYHHGMTYSVPLSVVRSLRDIIANAWRHEEVVGNVNRARYDKNPIRDIALKPGMESFQHPNSTIMRV